MKTCQHPYCPDIAGGYQDTYTDFCYYHAKARLGLIAEDTPSIWAISMRAHHQKKRRKASA